MSEQQAEIDYPSIVEPMFEANSLDGDPNALRERLARDGYLLFRNVIDPAKLRSLRARITEVLADLGWIEDGRDRELAKLKGLAVREGEDKFFEAYDRLVGIEELYSLPHDRYLQTLLRAALGESVFPHPLSIIRLVFPGHPEISTPPHQDYRNNQGTVDLTATWMPLADCPMDSGALAVLEGSHRAGLLPIQFHLGPGNRAAVLSQDLRKLRWLSTDFNLGDVLLFPSLTVHRALHNSHPESMRLSVDYRHQLEGHALTPPCLQPHFGRTSWEEIYAGWESDELQYYWQKKNFIEVPWDSTLHKLDGDPQKHLEEIYHEGMRFEKSRRDRLKERTAAQAER